MQKWEYSVADVLIWEAREVLKVNGQALEPFPKKGGFKGQNLYTWLAMMGELGWEVVSDSGREFGSYHAHMIILKRPLPESAH